MVDFLKINLSDRDETLRIGAAGEVINMVEYEHDPSILSDFFVSETLILRDFSLLFIDLAMLSDYFIKNHPEKIFNAKLFRSTFHIEKIFCDPKKMKKYSPSTSCTTYSIFSRIG